MYKRACSSEKEGWAGSPEKEGLGLLRSWLACSTLSVHHPQFLGKYLLPEIVFWLKVWVLETIHSCEDAGSAPNQLGGLRQSVPLWASVSSSVDGEMIIIMI